MIKRSLLVNSRSYISSKNKQLVIRVDGREDDAIVPAEDIGYLEFDSLQSTITTATLALLAEQGATVAICDARHHPVALLQPLEGNTLHAERHRSQIVCRSALKRRLWQSIVKAKIRNQARVLDILGDPSPALKRRVTRVLSGDSTNQEGVAARFYWQATLRPFKVRRDPDGNHPNAMLNYGYAVLRAAIARAIVASGLHPALGIKHSHRNNGFALADDLMEPYRPFVDLIVLPCALGNDQLDKLTPSIKSQLLALLVMDTQSSIGRRPLFNSVMHAATALTRSFEEQSDMLDFPEPCEPE